jgi:hypothetical protein
MPVREIAANEHENLGDTPTLADHNDENTVHSALRRAVRSH